MMGKVSIARRRLEVRFRDPQAPSPGLDPSALAAGTLIKGSFGWSNARLLEGTALAIPVPDAHAQALESLAAPDARGNCELRATLRRERSILVLKIQPAGTDRPMICCGKVADILCMSRASVYRLAREGKIPSYRVGRLLRFDPADVFDFLARCLEEPGGKPCI